MDGLLEVFGEEEGPAEEVAANDATVLECSTGPFVIVSSPFEDVVNL